jgi:BirA family biotin operon repressor/biotin-[acetyl-CoA-carboxylase] ligase
MTLMNNLADIQQGFHPRIIGSRIEIGDQVDSTNEIAKKCIRQGCAEGLVVVADSQTQGKGRAGRSWTSAPEVGIYFSTVIYPEKKDLLPQITLMSGVASILSIQEFCQAKITLKWPNDILSGNKKLCGILCETCPTANDSPAVVLGIGINVNQLTFPDEIQSAATSLKILNNGASVDRNVLIQSLMRHIDSEYLSLTLPGGTDRLIEKWSNYSDLFGKEITFKVGNTAIRGRAIGLNEAGNLIIASENGDQTAYGAGEITEIRQTASGGSRS